jgi:tetratricopeptide (TPR) repeat protein
MALDYLRKGHAPQANELAMRAVQATPNDWHARYALGQCFQTAGQWVQAAGEYAHANRLKPGEKLILLALGIARQKERKFSESVDALKEALHIDPDFELAYNSLGMGYRLSGDVPAALTAFDRGLQGMAAQVAREFKNAAQGPRYPYRITRHGMWLEYLRYGAEQISLRDGIHLPPILPDEATIERDARTKEFQSWFWADGRNEMNLSQRTFRPNFQNAMYEGLRMKPSFSTLLRNRAAALQSAGEQDLARMYEDEANDFA